MFRKVLQLVGMSCRHQHLSHPFAATAATAHSSADWENISEPSGHYVVCLDCGKRFLYDWSSMRIVR